MIFTDSNLRILGGSTGAAAGWSKSKHCTSGSCVEITLDRIAITDSKAPEDSRAVIDVDAEIWNELLDQIEAGSTEYYSTDLSLSVADDGSAIVFNKHDTLHYTAQEWKDFARSVKEGLLRVAKHQQAC